MGDNNSKEADFPKVFPQCPNCGSEHKIGQMIANGLIEEGRATPKMKAWLFGHNSVIQPDKPHFTAPVVKWLLDICFDCGTVYCVQVDVGVAMPEKRSGGPNVRFGEG